MNKAMASHEGAKTRREQGKGSVLGMLERHFDTAFAAPDGIKKLRELILTLAMQGKLVAQDLNDPPANALLKEIATKKQRLVKEGKIKKPRPLPEITPEEVPYELPQGWEWARLGEICSYIQRGKGPAYADISTHRVISQKCVRWYGLDIEQARLIDPKSLEKYEPIRFLRSGDLLWNSTGTGTIGRACLVPQELGDSELVADSHVTVVRPLTISAKYLWRWIQSPIVQNEIEGSASGTTNQIELNTSTVVNHLIPLAPIEEQHRIAAKIDQLMARCDELEKLRTEREQKRLAVHSAAITQLLDAEDKDSHPNAWHFLTQHFGELYSVKENVAELRKAILQLAVMGKLVPQNYSNDTPASELLKKIDTEKQQLVKAKKIKQSKPMPTISSGNKPFTVPDTWLWVRISDIAESIDYGTSQKTCDNSTLVPVYRMGNIVDGQLVDDGFKYISSNINDLPRLYLEPNDILFNRTNSYELVGKSALYCGPGGYATFASYLIRVRLLEKFLYPAFFSLAMNAPYFRATQIEPEIVQQCGQANFNGTKLSLCVVPLPPLKEQHRIVAKINQLMALCDTLEKQVDVATNKQTNLLNALVHKLPQNAANITDLATYRAAVGCYAIRKMADSPYFGRTAAAKVLYLAQAHIGLKLDLHPLREAAGPLDQWIYRFEEQGESQGWFKIHERKTKIGYKKVEYRPGTTLAEQCDQAETILSSTECREFNRLMELLGDKKTEEVEMIATLFAAWNDLLIDGHQPSDDQIVTEVREHWHEQKQRFSPATLNQWLDWLRRNNLIPQGRPPRTSKQTPLGL